MPTSRIPEEGSRAITVGVEPGDEGSCPQAGPGPDIEKRFVSRAKECTKERTPGLELLERHFPTGSVVPGFSVVVDPHRL